MIADLDPLVRGVSVGAFCLTAISVWRTGLRRDARIGAVLACLSAAAWTLTESEDTVAALGHPRFLSLLAFPVAGFFWLFVTTVFDDQRVTPARLLPAALFVGLGVVMGWAPVEQRGFLNLIFNILAAGLCLHAAVIILQGWRGDLVESRRTLRAAVLGFAALFSAGQGAVAVLLRFDPTGPWSLLSIQGGYAALIVAVIALFLGALLLEGRAALLAPVSESVEDARLVAIKAGLHAKLNRAMEAGAWREEALTVGSLAQSLAVPEHQLRALINDGLGHRNFAAFLNGYRVRAAKASLGNPAEARVTIAAIAFDVGFGSLSPFNRAFRATTGETPKAWRQRALSASNRAEIGD